MQITYGSVCSGIEAASVAWESLGLRPAWFSQFDPEHNYNNGPDFPSAVLAQHWPEVTNLGDMTKIAARVRAGEISAPDILVGGTPCQAFSVAGARKGLSDARGQLTISYVDLADAIDEQRTAAGEEPAIVVWENVPGVLSSKDNAFGAFLGLLAGEDCELQPPGKRWATVGCVLRGKRAIAWRVLDAQYFGVAQRRRRVFVVASARNDFDPVQVLFECEGLRRDTAPSRSKGTAVAALTANGVGTCGADDNQGQAGHLIAMAHGQGGAEIKTDNSAPTLTCNHEAPIVVGQFSSTGQGAWAPGPGTWPGHAARSRAGEPRASGGDGCTRNAGS
jgi:DNA (cytosine-5)-methyltransferase 1